MRVRQLPASPLHPKIRFAFADHPLIAWADAIFLRLSLEPIGLRNEKLGFCYVPLSPQFIFPYLQKCGLIRPTISTPIVNSREEG
jgi:hypothetical protein